MTILRATVRLQFNKDFTFKHGADCVDYYANLGISHYYASPIGTARSGSGHGYDVIDFGQVNPELGGEAGLRAMVARLRERDMGLLVDIVPNHMAVGEADNPWWLDVLEWGQASPYANHFDIDWTPPDETLHGKLLAPFLGQPLAEALAADELKLGYDPERGSFHVDYYAHRFPIAAAETAGILEAAGPALELADDWTADLWHSDRETIAEARSQLASALACTRSRRWLDTLLAGWNGADSRHRLGRLLDRQHYVLADWREASQRINWRRFFDVTTLAALRAERDEVFEDTHALPMRLYREGLVDGFRIDHIDGLSDPAGYLARLRERLTVLHEQRRDVFKLDSPWLVVEKILTRGERLRADWQADGATGYKFMDAVSGLLHDPAGEAPLSALWQDFAGEREDAASHAYLARRELAETSFGAELEALTGLFSDYAGKAAPDWQIDASLLRLALIELLACFPVYRSYVGEERAERADRNLLQQTLAAAEAHWAEADHRPLSLLARWVESALAELPEFSDETAQLAHSGFQRMQKLLPALDAKSVEDTVFYRYGRLLSRNEVGSWPDNLAVTPESFHAQNIDRALRVPRSIVATSTHDQKRGEDARMRLAVLSEMPRLWTTMVGSLQLAAQDLRSTIAMASDIPTPQDELMLYQALIGSWPATLRPDDGPGLTAYRERIAGWQLKALREAKLRTSWVAPDEAFEQGNRAFLDAMLADPVMVDAITAFVDRIAPYAALNSLSQTLLRLTVPGVPDLYQGAEFWDLSLVDPDNRRPVDYASRRQALASLETPAALLAEWRDARVKQALIAATLALRKRWPEVFANGSYQPLKLLGPQADSALAFMRRGPEGTVIVIVSRLARRLDSLMSRPLIDAACWQGCSLLLPPDAPARLSDALGDGTLAVRDGRRIDLADALVRLPVALLAYPATATK